MQFYFFKRSPKNLGELVKIHKNKVIFPCIILEKDTFNDFRRFHTTFRMTYFGSEYEQIYIGKLKIMCKDDNDTILPSKFEKLEISYCSIGQETSYYIQLYNLLKKEKMTKLLQSLNDVIFSKKDFSELHKTEVFNTSLLRFSEAQKLYNRGYWGIWEDIRTEKDNQASYSSDIYNLRFESKLPGCNNLHTIHLDFSPVEYLPYRLHTFIGKNSTGKSKILSNMAKIFSGINLTDDCGKFLVFNKNTNLYEDNIPPFRKVISVSYSPFDNYPESNTFSYIHFSLKDIQNKISLDSMATTLKYNYNLVNQRKRQQVLYEILDTVLNFDNNSFHDKLKDLLNNPGNVQNFTHFSSGQLFMIYTFVNILASIENESLILLDEPDLYLHPNAINQMVGLIYIILERYKSYGIIATHSSFILQNVPSKYVTVFTRSVDDLPTKRLTSECFGASVTSVAKDIFHVGESSKSYYYYLNKMINTLSKEEIMKLFDDNISFGAGLYIETLISNK